MVFRDGQFVIRTPVQLTRMMHPRFKDYLCSRFHILLENHTSCFQRLDTLFYSEVEVALHFNGNISHIIFDNPKLR